MIYQINGKFYSKTEEPKGEFLRVVEVPGKLKNFITEEPVGPETVSMFIEEHHVVVSEDDKAYIDGQEL